MYLSFCLSAGFFPCGPPTSGVTEREVVYTEEQEQNQELEMCLLFQRTSIPGLQASTSYPPNNPMGW